MTDIGKTPSNGQPGNQAGIGERLVDWHQDGKALSNLATSRLRSRPLSLGAV
jgi:hypothetical protein